MQRRTFLTSVLAGGAALAAPGIVQAEQQRVLRFIPQSDVTVLDPVWTTADVTRNFGFMVYDTLYGLDANYAAHPQMVAGHTVSSDHKEWTLTLRDGLTFHDNTPVLARDVVASLHRWGQRDVFGGKLMAAVDELSAPSDTMVRFRLKRPFPLLPTALATPTNMACIMPERLARTSPAKRVPEVVGSGPFRFVAKEHVVGARVVFDKFAGYVPRQNGETSFTAGPKVVHFDRVVWTVVPDPATAMAALSAGEYDWWENPIIDLVPSLKRDPNLRVEVKDDSGEIGCLRFNHLFPPFDNQAIRQVVLRATNQKDFMMAVAGSDPSLIRTGISLFAPGTPFAGKPAAATQGPVDFAALKADLVKAGYKGEKVVVLAAADRPTISAIAEVGADMLKKLGFNVDYQSLDWGTVVQRRASKNPPAQGGWNIFFTYLGGVGNVIPAADIAIGSGPTAWFGWPTMPRMEHLMEAWFAAPDLKAQQHICDQMRAVARQDVPFVPLGLYEQPTVYHKDITGIPQGFPLFYGVRRT